IMDVSDFLATQKIQGMGFRGKTFGSLIFHGIEPHEGNFYIKNSENQSLEKISDEESYQIVLPDQYLFAWYFPLLKKLGKSEILFPYFLREIVAEHFKNK
ncbi:MAG: bifunctional metallophosphatase/5'-nucleotidase, partial [Lactococcus lactis]|nr:bifunctional metallophosphatase/5'-nucleotidase [Lactococcus lactis]